MNNIKIDLLRNRMWGCVLDSSGSG